MKALLSATAILTLIALIISISGCSALTYRIKEWLTGKERQEITVKAGCAGLESGANKPN